ncbi:DUF58 domain-containing protein [Leptolyngbya cf. ectocarpi LEGE 11479]|uniref:DUF58 domain-containing protein n=1 Tax=Leptolyngbya cf. ectocarpi LEGE 11479 TaxID=1828722 RepID=A0A929FCQ9_LEPEC|nr:DUF58 domain-containing protein [Leptolyngbya ectocarpi]MBE9070327.1 DUF58 domain-containing protein [Leptolyngbya cf. ectocarpi LEGE 11479]
MNKRITNWLENNWVTPAYSGWVLLGITLCFLGAATNTMAGWLYVISGITIALLSVSSILPQRALQGLSVSRQMPRPVSAGESLSMVVTLENGTLQAKSLLQLQDLIPAELGGYQTHAIALLEGQTKNQTGQTEARSQHTWRYEIPTQKRGIYTWPQVRLRTAAPLGLFWCSRLHPAKAKAIVYPQILPLDRCPVIDSLGTEVGRQQLQKAATNATGTEGLTRALRPYRWGDPTRLIHWRTSARYGELRVRELEVLTSHQSLIIAIDTSKAWDLQSFEQAVVAAASLYHYGQQQGLATQLWSAQTGLVQETTAVLTVLAGIQFDDGGDHKLPAPPLIWLTSQANRPLPPHSAEILFLPKTAAHSGAPSSSEARGLVINPVDDLQRQLQGVASAALS